VGWNRLKRAFIASVAISLIGRIASQIAIQSGSGNFTTLLNLSTVFALVGGLAIVLGIILLGRWIWVKSNQLLANRNERLFSRKPIAMRSEKAQEPQNNDGQKNNVTDRWNALVRYDEEIRAAAEELRPFGDFWVTELGKAYLALNHM
jgi:hypothetical protein